MKTKTIILTRDEVNWAVAGYLVNKGKLEHPTEGECQVGGLANHNGTFRYEAYYVPLDHPIVKQVNWKQLE